MPFDSLGDFIKAADAVGEVQFVEGVDLELGRRRTDRADRRTQWPDARRR